MSRDVAVVALGRFLVVERYRERCPSSPDEQDSSSDPRVPARPRRG